MRHSVLPLFGALALSLTGAALLGAQQLSQAAPPASHSDVSVAFRFGTPGFGLEVGKLLTGHVAARVGVNYYKISTTKSQSDISYAASLKLHALAVLIDLYPGQRGGFHFTGGIVTNPLTITATGQPSSGSYTINGNTYSSSQVGILTAQGKFPGASPYLGLGFGTPASSGRAIKLLFDLGAVIGKPTISLTATGAASDPTLAADLQAQANKTQGDVDKYLKVYPVLAFGLAYRF